ncbi:MAG: tRNA 2-thiouridine(34) synthase MnmA [Candidatus Binatia bacterium]
MKTEASGGLASGGRPRVVVAMSGGVDSSVAAALLIEAGYDVEGASLRLWDSTRTDDRICSDHRDAARVAKFLRITHTLIDQRERFESRVVAPFVAAYADGRTPNPCAACNSEFKLGWLSEWAAERGSGAVATGHYARVDRSAGRVRLRRGADPARDQSYFLFQLDRRRLERTLFPLGEWRKDEVRNYARSLGLPVSEKLDSQDLCFGDPARLVAARARGGGEGEIVDESGRRLGRHPGIERFTVGQRRGLGIAAETPLYVQALDAATRRVKVAPAPPRALGLVARDWTWIDDPPAVGEELSAQIRHRHPAIPARVGPCPGADGRPRMRVDFDRPALSVAAGQAVVVYRGDEVVGGGWIERAIPLR